MKRTAFFTAVLALSPALALAHPGHSVLDVSAGPPHAGHEAEFAVLLITLLAIAALANGVHWLVRRRR
ncbi:MAG: hypothetical protein K8R23_07210 [Chthoniobacter sp.]|nr:hypothetical protein [Chthoniobacter sp.]